MRRWITYSNIQKTNASEQVSEESDSCFKWFCTENMSDLRQAPKLSNTATLSWKSNVVYGKNNDRSSLS